jgi:hypothetical protein
MMISFVVRISAKRLVADILYRLIELQNMPGLLCICFRVLHQYRTNLSKDFRHLEDT